MQESQNSEPSHVVNGLDIDPSSLPSWISEFEERKQRILGEAVEAQNRLDPNGRFDALSRGQKTRLTKALFRFFLFQQGRFPSLPIPREDVMRVFETVRSEANLASTPKLFPYFLTEVRKEMAEWGLDIREMEKKVPSSMARNRKTVQWSYVFYLQSFLPEEFRMTFMEKREKQLIGILGVLVRLTVAGEGKLRRSDAIQLLKNVRFGRCSGSVCDLVGIA